MKYELGICQDLSFDDGYDVTNGKRKDYSNL